MPHHYAIFAARYSPLIGGVESYVAQLAHELATQGNEVVVVTSLLDASPEWEECADGVMVVRVPASSILGGRLPLPKRNAHHSYLMRCIGELGIDRVLVNNRFYGHSFDGLTFAEEINAPVVLLDHGSAYLTLGNPVADWAIRRYEHIVTEYVKMHNPIFCGVSKKSADWLRYLGIEHARVLPNAIDADAFCSMSSGRDFRNSLSIGNRILVTFVGRLTAEKGVDSLVKAAASFSDSGVVFALAGDGVLRKKLEPVASSNVHFLGPLDRSDLSALLQSSDAFCLPTRSEGFCTALLEASACGLPSAITDVGGVDEVFKDESYGIVMPDGSEQSVLVAIETLIELGQAGRLAMGERVKRAVAQNCTWAKTVEALERLYDNEVQALIE